jgi:hypothetical protein
MRRFVIAVIMMVGYLQLSARWVVLSIFCRLIKNPSINNTLSLHPDSPPHPSTMPTSSPTPLSLKSIYSCSRPCSAYASSSISCGRWQRARQSSQVLGVCFEIPIVYFNFGRLVLFMPLLSLSYPFHVLTLPCHSCALPPGFGFEGYDDEGKSKGFGGVENIDILGFELASNVQMLSRNWNKRTQVRKDE